VEEGVHHEADVGDSVGGVAMAVATAVATAVVMAVLEADHEEAIEAGAVDMLLTRSGRSTHQRFKTQALIRDMVSIIWDDGG